MQMNKHKKEKVIKRQFSYNLHRGSMHEINLIVSIVLIAVTA